MAAQHYKLREALDEARRQAERLERERDQALRKAADQEAEMERQREQAQKMTRMVERGEADHRALEAEHRQLQVQLRTLKAEQEALKEEHNASQEELQRERAELQQKRAAIQRVRREHRDALEQVAALKSEAQQAHMRAEELQGRLEVATGRLEATIAEHQQRVEQLEGVGKRASQELEVQSSRAAGLGEALYSCLHERPALLHFLVDVLSTIRSLFCEPPAASAPAAGGASPRRGSPRTPRRAGSRGRATPKCVSRGGRERSSSCERIHRHTGCYVCGGDSAQASQEWRLSLRESSASLRGQAPAGGTTVSPEDQPALQEVMDALERELGEASQEYSALVQRLLAEAERTARILRGQLSPTQTEPPSEQDVRRTCLDWVEQERLRRERQRLPMAGPVPCVDWSEERDRYAAATRSMEAKFARLARLRRLMQNGTRHSAGWQHR